MKRMGLFIMGSLFLLVSTMVIFWMLAIVGFANVESRKERVYREGGE